MIDTAWSILAALACPFAVGLPLCWLLRGARGPLHPRQWLEAPFVGIAASVLVLQNLAYSDIPISAAAGPFWAAVALVWVVWWRRGSLKQSLSACPRGVLLTAVAVYLVHGTGLLLAGARYYVGKAWGDQFNYTVLAQFLSDDRFSTTFADVTYRPYLLSAINVKLDRIGQSVFHGFVSVSSFEDAKTLFEPVILLSSALTVIACYAIVRQFGLLHRTAVITAAAAALLPAVAWIHLESFLSQALAVPLLFMYVFVLAGVTRHVDLGRLGTAALIAAVLVSTYTELWIVLVVLALLCCCIAALERRHVGWLVISLVTVSAAPFALNPHFAASVLAILGRVSAPVMGALYPWAYTAEGVTRVWTGELFIGVPPVLERVGKGYGLLATGLGYLGFAAYCAYDGLKAVRGCRLRTRRRALRLRVGAWATLALVCLPVLVLARDREHAYQFYKLLLTTSPLLVIGLVLLARVVIPRLFPSPRAAASSSRLAWRVETFGAGSVALVGLVAAAGSLQMAWHSTSLQPSERYNGAYLLAAPVRAVQDKLEALTGQDIFFFETDPTWNAGLINAWLTYFARHNRVWLGNSHVNDIDLKVIPQAAATIDPSSLPDGALILVDADSSKDVALILNRGTSVWSNGPYALFKSDSDHFSLSLIENLTPP